MEAVGLQTREKGPRVLGRLEDLADPFVLEVLDELPRRGRALDLTGARALHAGLLLRHGLDVLTLDPASWLDWLDDRENRGKLFEKSTDASDDWGVGRYLGHSFGQGCTHASAQVGEDRPATGGAAEVCLACAARRGAAGMAPELADRGCNFLGFGRDFDPSLPGGPFQVILATWLPIEPCRSSRDTLDKGSGMWPALATRLGPGGHLVVVHPTLRNLERRACPGERYLLIPGTLDELAMEAGLWVERFEEGWDAFGLHTARLHARAPG